MASSRTPRFTLPLQVAAVCYRERESGIEFLLVNTNGGNKWTFPKGDPDSSLSHSAAAAREACEEAGVRGSIEPRHFCLYLHSKGVFWKSAGIREFVVKAFLLEVKHSGRPDEEMRNPRWFSPDQAKAALAKGREVKYARELQAVVERATEEIAMLRSIPIRPGSSRRARSVSASV
jgi:8-oxo-dGTP pyrophosphatase MutT (NUDIX family)